jgi:bifunctional UDP-N-acetylglucosamine pyrophosphorylase/glucosamine-1-phosphate N-acetyltransferase
VTITESPTGNVAKTIGPNTAVIVLAAGAGTRMKSDLAKPLHSVAGLPMVEHVVRAGDAINPDATVLLASPQVESHIDLLDRDDLTVVYAPPRGTGDAVRVALDAAPDAELAIVLYADHPLLDEDTVKRLKIAGLQPGIKVAVLTFMVADAGAYGRIARDEHQRPTRIIEFKNDSAAARAGEIEINLGMMALDAAWAREELSNLEPDPETQEWLLTDLIERAVTSFTPGDPWPVVTVQGSQEVAIGVNDRSQLADAESVLLDRIRRAHMREGVTIQLPETVLIEADVTIGKDTTILPGTILRRGVSIGNGCEIGPNTLIERSQIGDYVRVTMSVIRDSVIDRDSDVGPFAHLRGGATIGPSVHIGNFAEIKNSTVEQGVKIGHVSYLGDARVGEGTNIGAGTITANYDGKQKHLTQIGSNAFIGSDTMLVAPVTIGDDARTGAGSVVTRDVPPGVTVVGVPARPRPAVEASESGKEERNR